MPNPTPPAEVDVAEGERLLASVAAPRPWRQSLTDDTMILTMDSREIAAIDGDYNSPDEWPVMEANAALIVFAVNNLPALLRAASERDAAVREAERLREAAKLDYAAYVKAYYEHKAAGNDAAKDRCGARILTLERIFPEFENGVVVDPAALASAAPGGANG